VDSAPIISAAFRLKHDLGKAVRWNAPFRREASADVLRRRLAKDLLETRVDGEGRVRSAVDIFDAWLSVESDLFQSDPESAARIARMSAAVEVLRPRLSRLADLEWDDLVALDDASIVLAEEARSLWRDWAAESPREVGP
jgi:hypothetical protein